jgi:chromosome segregation ATPase
MSDQPGSFFSQLQACKKREADLRKARDGLRERIAELERELSEERELRHGLDDGGRAAAQRALELERERDELQDAFKVAAAVNSDLPAAHKRIEELERERDEARKLARMYRTVTAMDNPPELPWEESE